MEPVGPVAPTEPVGPWTVEAAPVAPVGPVAPVTPLKPCTYTKSPVLPMMIFGLAKLPVGPFEEVMVEPYGNWRLLVAIKPVTLMVPEATTEPAMLTLPDKTVEPATLKLDRVDIILYIY